MPSPALASLPPVPPQLLPLPTVLAAYVLALTEHTLDEAMNDPWVGQVQGMVAKVLRDDLADLEGELEGGSGGSKVEVTMGEATSFGWGKA